MRPCGVDASGLEVSVGQRDGILHGCDLRLDYTRFAIKLHDTVAVDVFGADETKLDLGC